MDLEDRAIPPPPEDSAIPPPPRQQRRNEKIETHGRHRR